jgi:hypothetical protein
MRDAAGAPRGFALVEFAEKAHAEHVLRATAASSRNGGKSCDDGCGMSCKGGKSCNGGKSCDGGWWYGVQLW